MRQAQRPEVCYAKLAGNQILGVSVVDTYYSSLLLLLARRRLRLVHFDS